tara:strand:- start:347 stop:643 length:297 start_codon:yes stop_codon:yes gene_type:complete
MLLTPNIILFSFSKEIYGRWYNPASGRLTLLYIINKKVKKEERNKKAQKFLENFKFDLLTNKIIITEYKIEFIKGLNLIKKFKNRLINDNATEPIKNM